LDQEKIKSEKQDDSKNASHQRTFQSSEKPFWKSLVGKLEAVLGQEIRVIIMRKLDNREDDFDRENEDKKSDVNVLTYRRQVHERCAQTRERQQGQASKCQEKADERRSDFCLEIDIWGL
jgi:hypothetical protein